MKKIVLLSIIIGFAFSTMAQNQMVSVKNQKRVLNGQEVAIERTQKVPTPEFKQSETLEDVSRIYVGTAKQELFINKEEAHIISYNYEMDVIGVTGILDSETYPNVSGNSTVGMWYSTDKGQSWSDPVILNTTADYSKVSGILFNPAGNTVVENMFGVHQGTGLSCPSYLDFGSNNLGNENLTNYIFEVDGYDFFYNIYGLNQFGNEIRCLNRILSGFWGGLNNNLIQIIVGEYNGVGFNWDLSNIIHADSLIGGEGIVSNVFNSGDSDSGLEIAWSDDGMIGYIWMLAVADAYPTGYQPVVFKTNDAGESWDYIYLDFFSDEMQNILELYLYESSAGNMIPHVFESAGVVDYSGNLQMMVAMGSTSADVITYPDSLGSHWEYPGDLFNLVVDEDGISELIWVDSLKTENVLSDTPGNYCGTVGWQHRISAAKSQDEKQWFFTWIDTRDTSQTINLKPDLFGWSNSVYGMMDSTVCFSEGTELEESFYFNTGSDKAYYNMDEGKYVIPYLQGVTPLEFLINTSSSGDPITLSYVTGVEFPDLSVGIDEFASTNGIRVSQNTPNPFNGSTTIEVSTKTASLVTVEVSNIMGQLIYTVDAGIVIGTQEIELSSKNLETGIYLYTVNVGSESVTKKMIVE